MLKHRASVHDDVRTFRCPYCDAMFSQRGLCDTHVRTVHDKKQAKYFCEHCGLPFSRKVQLNEHYEQVHPEYMATYGRYQAGQSSTTPGMPSTSRTARGGPAEELAAEQRPFELSTAESRLDAPIPPLLGMGALARTRPPPTGAPQPWIPFTTSQPLTREQGAPEESSGRQRSFQGDSSGGQGQ